MNLTRESILRLQELKRYDLILPAYIIDSGFAGALSTGEIFDRRFFPEAVAMAENPMMGIPKPKDI